MSDHWLFFIARASVLLLLSGAGVLLLTRWQPLRNPRWHRLAWGVVLVQGVILFPFSWDLPLPVWLTPTVSGQPLAETAAAQVSHPDVAVYATAELSGACASEASFPGTRMANEIITSVSVDVRARPAVADAAARSATVQDPTSSFPSSADGRASAVNHVSEDALAVGPAAIASAARREADSGSPSSGTGHAAVVGPLRTELAAAPWGAFLMIVWVGGVLVMIGTLIRHYVLLNRALSHCRPARGGLAQELQDLCLELGLHQEVRLELHRQLGPFLCWTPRGYRVVVPFRLWNRLSAEERTAVLHHELCHLRRGDLWKSLLARLVVAIHWFNPFAWVSAARFDESAEWSCDARMGGEAPTRMTQLANALLAAAECGENSPMLALSATGGPLFRRVRRLVAPNPEGDMLMPKCLWTGLLLTAAISGSVRFQLAPTAVLAADEPGAAAEADATADAAAEADATPEVVASTDATPAESSTSPLAELASRIVVGDNENLKAFVTLIQSPTGEIVMADRAAVQAQNAMSDTDPASLWEQFLERHFDRSGDTWTVRPDRAAAIAEYLRAVKTAVEDEEAMCAVFREVAAGIDANAEQSGDELKSLLRRFLQHEAAAAAICHGELRENRHPGIRELASNFGEYLVRTQKGVYVIRPARRRLVERRLEFVSQLDSVLRRFEKELAAWADELVKEDDLHRQFAEILARPEFAGYVVFSHVSEENSRVRDEELEGMFAQLEEATSDTAAGLRLNPDSEDYRALQEIVQGFTIVWENRETLAEPLHRMADGIDESDDLHQRLRAFLKTDLALMLVAHKMGYRPVPADTAAREWLTQVVTQNAAGRYEISVDSEELRNGIEDYFRGFRDLRRHGRMIDDVALRIADSNLRTAMQSLPGKQLLKELVELSTLRPEVDGLQLWFAEHFEETPDGLVLRDWAADELAEIIAAASAVEKELSKTDF